MVCVHARTREREREREREQSVVLKDESLSMTEKQAAKEVRITKENIIMYI